MCKKYLNSKRMYENVYYMNKTGREYIGMEKQLPKPNQLEHKVMRSDMFLYFDCPDSWEPEHLIKWHGKREEIKRIIPDAFFIREGTQYFVEVDNKQTMKKNMDKIDLYAEILPALEKEYKMDCILIFYTQSEARKMRLYEYCTEKGVTCGAFVKNDLEG